MFCFVFFWGPRQSLSTKQDRQIKNTGHDPRSGASPSDNWERGQAKNNIFDSHHRVVVARKDWLQPGVKGGRLKCKVCVEHHVKTAPLQQNVVCFLDLPWRMLQIMRAWQEGYPWTLLIVICKIATQAVEFLQTHIISPLIRLDFGAQWANVTILTQPWKTTIFYR